MAIKVKKEEEHILSLCLITQEIGMPSRAWLFKMHSSTSAFLGVWSKPAQLCNKIPLESIYTFNFKKYCLLGLRNAYTIILISIVLLICCFDRHVCFYISGREIRTGSEMFKLQNCIWNKVASKFSN